jgi:hypothetical protein
MRSDGIDSVVVFFSNVQTVMAAEANWDDGRRYRRRQWTTTNSPVSFQDVSHSKRLLPLRRRPIEEEEKDLSPDRKTNVKLNRISLLLFFLVGLHEASAADVTMRGREGEV